MTVASGLAELIATESAVWADDDGDGRLDLFVSNMGSPARLHHSEGGGRFVDFALGLGNEGPPQGFACTFRDHDDGPLDVLDSDWVVSCASCSITITGGSQAC